MRRALFVYSIASVFALVVGVAAQNPPPNPQTQPQTPAPAAQAPSATVTVEGCLMREQDIPGRKPNVVERAGVAEDYILANAKIVKGAQPPATGDAARTAAPRPGEPDAARAGAPTTQSLLPMYDVKGLDGDRLKPLAGKRVQVEGTWADVGRDRDAAATEDLVDLRGTTIREVPGQCPAK